MILRETGGSLCQTICMISSSPSGKEYESFIASSLSTTVVIYILQLSRFDVKPYFYDEKSNFTGRKTIESVKTRSSHEV